MELAPLVLFVYNRPSHTAEVLDALALNRESKDSLLYVYSDEANVNKNQDNEGLVNQVRSIIKNEQRFKKIILMNRKVNLGVANSIIQGVSELLTIHNEIIVLEDDIKVSKGFLRYMNDALTFYKHNNKVGCIHAWNYNLDLNGQKEETFFLRGADCWGWATWKRAWDLFEPNGEYLLDKIKSKKLEYSFNRNGTHSFVKMLEDQINGKNDSWAIRWHASLFLNNKFCLQPVRPIVKNIGLDGSGVHSGSTPILQRPVDFINVNRIDIKESKWFFNAYKEMIREGARLSIWQLLKNWVKKFFPHS